MGDSTIVTIQSEFQSLLQLQKSLPLETILNNNLHCHVSTLPHYDLHYYNKLPDVIQSHLKDDNYRSGFLKPWNQIYYIINNLLFLWDFTNNNIQQIDMQYNIIACEVISPKPNCFDKEIKEVLLIANENEIGLFNRVKDENNQYQLFKSKYFINGQFNQQFHVTSSKSGRVFLSCGDNIMELDYQLQDSLFYNSCRLIKLKWDLFGLTQLFYNTKKESCIIKLIVDDERNICYSLNQEGVITIINISKGQFNVVGKVNVKEKAKEFIFHNGVYNIIDIQLISVKESNIIKLLVIDNLANHLYFASSIENDNSLTNLSVYYAFHNNSFNNNDIINNVNYYNRGLYLHSFYNNNNETEVYLQYMDRTEGLINHTTSLIQNKLKLKGRVLDIIEWDINFNQKLNIYNQQSISLELEESLNQCYSVNRNFVILTKENIYIINKLRPIDQLQYIYKSIYDESKDYLKLKNTMEKFNNNIQLFIQLYGKQFTIYCLLLLSSKNNFIIQRNTFNHNVFNYLGSTPSSYKLTKQYNQTINELTKEDDKLLVKGYLLLLVNIIQPIYNNNGIKVKHIEGGNSINIFFNIDLKCLEFIKLILESILESSNNLNQQEEQSQQLIDVFKLFKKTLSIIHFFISFQQFNVLNLISKQSEIIIDNFNQLSFKNLFNYNEKSINLIQDIYLLFLINNNELNIQKEKLVDYYTKNCLYLVDINQVIVTQAHNKLSNIDSNMISNEIRYSMKDVIGLINYLIEPVNYQQLLQLSEKLSQLGYLWEALLLCCKNVNRTNNEIIEQIQLMEILLNYLKPEFNNYKLQLSSKSNKNKITDNIINYLDKLLLCGNKPIFYSSIINWFNNNNLLNVLLSCQSKSFLIYLKYSNEIQCQLIYCEYLMIHYQFNEASFKLFNTAKIESENLNLDDRLSLLLKAKLVTIYNTNFKSESIRKNHLKLIDDNIMSTKLQFFMIEESKLYLKYNIISNQLKFNTIENINKNITIIEEESLYLSKIYHLYLKKELMNLKSLEEKLHSFIINVSQKLPREKVIELLSSAFLLLRKYAFQSNHSPSLKSYWSILTTLPNREQINFTDLVIKQFLQLLGFDITEIQALN
ncbi:hypothetical protein K502DRAFT_340701 [Neoconidiobolus thromboides FSU 785]|nr:hypothetical protein K502DRAFT_340701 [Neoconidiobolus thromboides FSU 785]